MSIFLMLLTGFAGAFVHWLKLNTVGKIDAGEALGFWQWLISASPVKSLSVWVLLAVGVVAATVLGAVTFDIIGYVLAFLYGYFLDSLFKRYVARKDKL